MRQTGGEISYEGDGFEVNETLFTYSEEEQEENRIAKNNAALVLRPEFFTIDYQMLHAGFTWYECAIYGFIKFFLKNNSRFYCTNEQLAEMLGVGERSIIAAMSHLQEVGLIRNKYKIKAGGGKIRFVELQKTTTPKSKICFSDEQIPLDINNKIINNKLSISNDIDNISTPPEKNSITIKQKINITPKEQTPLPGPLPEDVQEFLKDSYEKYPSTKYQIDKQGSKYFFTTIKDLEKLDLEYGRENVRAVLRFIKQDDFRCKQIQSIGKLRKKNKDGIPYIVVIMDKMIQTKANIIDLDSL